MRQRKEKNIEERMGALTGFAIESPGSLYKGRWRELFEGPSLSRSSEVRSGASMVQGAEVDLCTCEDISDGEPLSEAKGLYAEFGCGKGKFSSSMAALHPEDNYLAFDGNSSVLLLAAERSLRAYELSSEARLRGRPNLLFVRSYINDARDIFAPGELSGIYLNFVDPWPKDRHAKRRLTHRDFLKQYHAVLEEGRTVELRTDSEILFDFTLREIASDEIKRLFEPEALSCDLHKDAENLTEYARLIEVTTEYEDKFAGKGKNINYLRLVKINA